MLKTLPLLLCLLPSLQCAATPLYWLASKDNTQLMIIGSIHVGNENMYPLPTELTQFLKNSDGLIVEADINDSNSVTYPPASDTEDVLNSDEQQKLQTIADDLDIDSDRLLLSPAWVSALTIQVAQMKKLGYNAEFGVDQHLMQMAQEENIPIIGLESMQFQIDLLASQDGKSMLMSVIDDYKETGQQLECLIKSWQAGDKNNLLQFAQDVDFSSQMEQEMLHERNQHWVTTLTDDISHKHPGNYVMVVGTLHLIGAGSVIELLAQQGFTIEQHSTSQTAGCRFELESTY